MATITGCFSGMSRCIPGRYIEVARPYQKLSILLLLASYELLICLPDVSMHSLFRIFRAKCLLVHFVECRPLPLNLDPSHQNEKDDPLPQYRHRRPIGGMRGRVCDQALLQQSLTGLRSEDLE